MTSTIIPRVQPLVRIFQNQQSRQNIQTINSTLLRKFCVSSTSFNSIQINITPKEALLDNPPKICVEGLNKDQRVTLWNTFTDDSGLVFSSHAHYIADGNGVVEVWNQMSYGGKYKGIFAEGLMSSLQAAPPVYKDKAHLKWARMFKKNVTEPMQYTLNVIDGHVSEEELYSDATPKSLGETKFLRHLMAEGVKRIDVEVKNIRGTLFLPPGEGPFPAVIDLFGAEPGIKEFRSAMLSSYGYATLVLPYYSYKDLPPLQFDLHLDYFLEAIDYFTALPQTSNKGIGLIGSSKGGEISMALCTISDKIKACVTINAYNKSVDVNFFHNKKLYVEGLVGDKKIGNVYFDEEGKFVTYGTDDHYTWDSDNILPIEKVLDDCEILIASGDQDGCHGHRSAVALKERARNFKKKNISAAVYPACGHLIDPPFHSHIDAVWNSAIPVRKPDGTRHKGVPHYYGGTTYGACQARKDLWKRMLGLFHKRLVQDAGLPVDQTRLHPPY